MKYYLSVPCVSCSCVSKGFKGQACLAMHFSSHHRLIIIIIMHSLASIPLLLISEDKGGPTLGH